MDRKNEKVKTSVLLTCWGQEGRDIYENFSFDNPVDEMKFVPVLEKFSEYCNPRKNITILRHNFLTYRQHLQENFCDFVRELKKLSSEYEFKTLPDSLIKDMIVSAGQAAQETRKHV